MSKQLAVVGSEALGLVLRGAAGTTQAEPLRSPASDTPCVHWRLRIVQVMGPGIELVHEITAPEPFELHEAADAGSRRLRIPLEARLDALPVLHRDGSPGALAVAQLFGMAGRLQVEEVVVRPGEALEVEGVVLPEPSNDGPFRQVELPTELAEAVVRLPGRERRGHLLPWALGTVAALASTVGLATTLAHGTVAASVAKPIGRAVLRTFLGHPAPPEIGPARPPRSRWP